MGNPVSLFSRIVFTITMAAVGSFHHSRCEANRLRVEALPPACTQEHCTQHTVPCVSLSLCLCEREVERENVANFQCPNSTRLGVSVLDTLDKHLDCGASYEMARLRSVCQATTRTACFLLSALLCCLFSSSLACSLLFSFFLQK